MSRLMSKWYGDSQKYISALFSLARKMAPSIIWIDEIDALFSQRSRSDHSADVYNKALFLSLWDGLANDIYDKGSSKKEQSAQVIILGASNRPQQVDEAFLRRMSRQYEFAMPDMKTRKLILSILLQTEKVHQNVDLNVIATKTAYYSGSDMKELCKYAATLPLREYVRKRSNAKENMEDVSMSDVVILDGIGRSKKATPNGLFSFSANSQCDREGTQSVNVMNVFENQKDDFVLRPIEQSDLLTALKHIKSTMKAHDDHKRKYGTNNKNSLFSNLGLFGMNGMNSSASTQSKQENVEVNEEENNDDDDILELE